MTKPHEVWSIIFINQYQEEMWNKMYDQLDIGYRWQVQYVLKYMVTYEKPWSRYRYVECDECIDGAMLLDVSHEGIGDKTVEVLVRFDKENKTITPLHCKLI